THLERPVFNTVKDAVEKAGADTSIIFVPAAFAADAIMEAADAGIKVIICITEGIPVKDMILTKEYLKGKACRLIGPNCPGVITAGEAKVGIMPGFVFVKGRTMGHAGAIVGGHDDTAQAKMEIMRECGIHVVDSPAEIGKVMAAVLKGQTA
ncbi:MAG: CoA-binding protein, partial [Moraxellaceae bacterium]